VHSVGSSLRLEPATEATPFEQKKETFSNVSLFLLFRFYCSGTRERGSAAARHFSLLISHFSFLTYFTSTFAPGTKQREFDI